MMTNCGFDLDDDGAGVPLEWRGMQLSDGSFRKGAAGAYRIEGRFHSAGREAAWGACNTGTYVGAFAARRQP